MTKMLFHHGPETFSKINSSYKKVVRVAWLKKEETRTIIAYCLELKVLCTGSIFHYVYDC